MTDKAVVASAPPKVVAVEGIRSAKDFRDATDALRNRVDWLGKVLVGIATLGTGAVGLAKVGDLFPVPDGYAKWAVGAVVGLVAAAMAAVVIAIRLMRVGEPAVIEVGVDASLPGITNTDMPNIERIFFAAASRFGFQSLAGLQERERSLRRAANRATELEEQGRRTALADEVRTEIETALARAQMAVVRRRTTEAVGTWPAFLLYTAVLCGLVLFAAGTDAVASARVEAGQSAKACGDARGAGATVRELKASGCGAPAKKSAPAAKVPSIVDQRSDFLDELAKPLSTCLKLSRERDTPRKDETGIAVTQAECARIAALVATFAKP